MRKQIGFWRLVFIVFPLIAVTLDTDIAFFGVQSLSIGRHGASFYHLGHPEGPWEQQEGHVGAQSQVFSDFGVILKSFWV